LLSGPFVILCLTAFICLSACNCWKMICYLSIASTNVLDKKKKQSQAFISQFQNMYQIYKLISRIFHRHKLSR